ncbi:VOC family protein [Achromobacter anxifer]
MTLTPSHASPADARPAIQGLHHFAWRCRDAEETRHFYEDILGLPLVHVVKEERVPSTGEHCPFVHLFFEFADGSHIAFFDLGDNGQSQPDPATPRWVNHFAMEIRGDAELERMRQRLLAHGVEVVGPTDHHFIRSIYFFDPNGVRLELTLRLPVDDYVARKRRSAHDELAAWTRDKAAGLMPGASGTSSQQRSQAHAG